MTRAKKLSRYPVEFLELAEKMEETKGARLLIPCKDLRAAQSLRFRLYGFRDAMEREGMAKDFPMLASAEMRIENEGLVLEAQDRTWAAELVANALHPEPANSEKE